MAMLGRLPEIHHLAGVNLAAVLFNVIYAVASFLRMGVTGHTAIAVGKSAYRESLRIPLRYSAVALFLASFILIGQSPVVHRVIPLLGADGEVTRSAVDYIEARIQELPAYFLNLVFMGWFLGRGKSSYVFIMTLSSTLTNVPLNYLFINVLHMGAAGAGYGTMISSYFMLLAAFFLLAFDRTPVHSMPDMNADISPANKFKSAPSSLLHLLDTLKKERKDLLAWDHWKQMFHLNADILTRSFLLMAAFSIFTAASGRLGSDYLAANSILLQFWVMVAFLIDGSANALETLGGQDFGRMDFKELRRHWSIAMLAGIAMGTLFAFFIVLFPRPFLLMVTDHNDIIHLSAKYVYWMIPAIIIGAVAFIYDGLFIGTAGGRALRNSMMISFTMYFLLAWLSLSFQSNHLLWLAFAAFLSLRAVTLAYASRFLLFPDRASWRAILTGVDR